MRERRAGEVFIGDGKTPSSFWVDSRQILARSDVVDDTLAQPSSW
jgi:hypothetical protein